MSETVGCFSLSLSQMFEYLQFLNNSFASFPAKMDGWMDGYPVPIKVVILAGKFSFYLFLFLF